MPLGWHRLGTYLVCGIGAAVVTFGLVSLMRILLTGGAVDLTGLIRAQAVQFVRLERDSEVALKDRRPPERKPPEDLPRPEIELAAPSKRSLLPSLSSIAPGSGPALDLAGAPSLGAVFADGDAVPLVRIEPQYPPAALRRGIEGWVDLEFTVTAAGTVRDVQVVAAEPESYFEAAARRAVLGYRYRPRVEDGVAVERTGVRLRIRFEIRD